MKVLDIDVNFNLYDADMCEKAETAMESVQKNIQKCMQEKDMKRSKVLRETCNLIDNFFIETLGEETVQKLFNGKADVMLRIRAFRDFALGLQAQDKELEEISKEFMPKRNRKK